MSKSQWIHKLCIDQGIQAVEFKLQRDSFADLSGTPYRELSAAPLYTSWQLRTARTLAKLPAHQWGAMYPELLCFAVLDDLLEAIFLAAKYRTFTLKQKEEHA